jgi:hypothetical protein
MLRAKIGDTVLYYQNGVRQSQPRPAIVMTASSDNSVLGLNVFPEQGGTMFFKRCVYHINDPHVFKNPAVAMSYGTWESRDPAMNVVPPGNAQAPSPVVHSPTPVPVEPESPPETGDPAADLMSKLLATAGK